MLKRYPYAFKEEEEEEDDREKAVHWFHIHLWVICGFGQFGDFVWKRTSVENDAWVAADNTLPQHGVRQSFELISLSSLPSSTVMD